MLHFEWDTDKANQNVSKHGISFHEAASVFGDPLALTFVDEKHSGTEERCLTVGFSTSNRLLIVAHSDRSNRIRIISARLCTRAERQQYEES